MSVNIYSHSTGSRGSKALSEALKAKRIRHQNSNYRGGIDKVVINWGSPNLPPEVLKSNVLNFPECVALAINKLDFFNNLRLGDTRTPPFTSNPETAKTWLKEGKTVVARTMLRASAGRGIVLMNKPEDFVQAQLYTEYVKKADEYRVHVFNGEVLDYQRKARNTEVSDDEVNWQIRTHDNGFIYMREGVQPPQDVINQAISAVKDLDLDFGAVDVIWNAKKQEAYVLEVNTAPGLEGTTLQKYTEAFKGVL